MEISQIKIGTRLELETVNNLGQESGPTYITQLLDVPDEKYLVVSCPIFESQYVLMSPGAKVRIVFLHDRYGPMTFTSIVYNREKSENIIALRLEVTGPLEKMQRRNFYRLDCLLDVNYRISAGRNADTDIKKVITKNISGAGMCLITNEDIPIDSILETELMLDENTTIKSKCRIVRNISLDNAKGRKYELGLFFIEVSKKDLDLLIKHIFQKQRQQLKRVVD